jgi:UDP-3-O-[3-hydroxymyristoyl] glucosamine N-acyltransferase
MADLHICGAGGHSRVVASAWPARCHLHDFGEAAPSEYRAAWHVAVGDPAIRAAAVATVRERGGELVSVVSPDAAVARDARICPGAYIGPHAVVEAGATIGEAAIVNAGALVCHGATIGDYAHIAPGAVICGDAYVGARALIGAGALEIARPGTLPAFNAAAVQPAPQAVAFPVCRPEGA